VPPAYTGVAAVSAAPVGNERRALPPGWLVIVEGTEVAPVDQNEYLYVVGPFLRGAPLHVARRLRRIADAARIYT
jgi:hypothetical protein